MGFRKYGMSVNHAVLLTGSIVSAILYTRIELSGDIFVMSSF